MQAAGVPVTSDIDHVSSRTEELLALVTHPIFSEEVPHLLTGITEPEKALRELRRRHAGLLCVTLGERGAMALDGDRLCHQPAFPVVARDTTGAGDVFRGGFIYGLLRGWSVPRPARVRGRGCRRELHAPGRVRQRPDARRHRAAVPDLRQGRRGRPRRARVRGALMRIALAQLNFTVGAFDANFARMREAVARARAAARRPGRVLGAGGDRLSAARPAAAHRLRRRQPRARRSPRRAVGRPARHPRRLRGPQPAAEGSALSTPPPSATAGAWSPGATSACCRPTTSSTKTATSSRRGRSRRSTSRASGSASHLRGRVERRGRSGRAGSTIAIRSPSWREQGATLFINISSSPFTIGQGRGAAAR